MTTNLDFTDTTDFDDADRGFIGAHPTGRIETANGEVAFDNGAYAFLDADCPDTANPSLWRQGQLASRQGLYEVTAGIYQVRGLDLSNMTIVEGDTGIIVIDPLITTETASAALALYREHRGDRPVTGMIYTHCHGDHFGGSRAIVPHGHDVPILAPEGFLEHAVSENVYAGNAMTRRAIYMYGSALDKSPAGQIGAGLGMTTSVGSITLAPPTLDITHTGQEQTIDGVRIVFQMTPGTEAPAEMNFLFPDRRTICMAENATHTMHNILTLRGAVVRDSRIWAHYLDETIALWGDAADVAFASHHWPTWGRERIITHLENQRDLYAYMHDQTLRLMNRGLNAAEIAEELTLPPSLEKVWANRGYYGSLSHNVKAIYQRYLGWFDGNPAHLWEHPPVELAKRYVDAIGGIDATIAKGEQYAADGDLRFAATLLNHAVFAEPDHIGVREALAQVYTRLGHGSENGTWRNFYLMAAQELRGDIGHQAVDMSNPEMTMALTVDQLIDSLAIRIDGLRAAEDPMTIDWTISDQDTVWELTLSHGALTYRNHASGGTARGADLALTLTKAQLLGVLGGGGLDGVEVAGDPGVFGRLVALLTTPDRFFPIVTP